MLDHLRKLTAGYIDMSKADFSHTTDLISLTSWIYEHYDLISQPVTCLYVWPTLFYCIQLANSFILFSSVVSLVTLRAASFLPVASCFCKCSCIAVWLHPIGMFVSNLNTVKSSYVQWGCGICAMRGKKRRRWRWWDKRMNGRKEEMGNWMSFKYGQ